jgi:hypothetical protein
MVSDDLMVQEPNMHIRILGTCWIIYGIIRCVAALWLVSFSNTATVMFGALLNRVSDPFSLMSYFHLFYTFAIVLSVVCGVVGILSGVALHAGHRSARMLSLLAGFLCLADIPLGLTIGIYSLMILLPRRSGHAAAALEGDRAGDLRRHPSTT